jgi:hypothetical protein
MIPLFSTLLSIFLTDDLKGMLIYFFSSKKSIAFETFVCGMGLCLLKAEGRIRFFLSWTYAVLSEDSLGHAGPE